MFILKTGHQPGVYVPLRALFLVCPACFITCLILLCTISFEPHREKTCLGVFNQM